MNHRWCTGYYGLLKADQNKRVSRCSWKVFKVWNKWMVGENSRLFESQCETSRNQNGDQCEGHTSWHKLHTCRAQWV